jgi:DNA (cytosine-5)-methyltransferase 1
MEYGVLIVAGKLNEVCGGKTEGGEFTVVDLFCGAGGLTQGFKDAKLDNFSFKIVAAVDIWSRAVETYKLNHPEVKVIQGDIRDPEVKEKLKKITDGHVDVVIGGPPCEAFSLAGKRDPMDPRARLFYDYVDIVKELNPYMFLMENVKGILSMITIREDISDEKKREVLAALNKLLELDSVGKKRRAAPQYLLRGDKYFDDPEKRRLAEYVRQYVITVPDAIKEAFGKIGYDVKHSGPINAADYGVPQERIRVFFIGAKKGSGINIRFPEPTHAKIPIPPLKPWRTLRDAIGHLPPFEEREDDEVYDGSFSTIFMSRNRRMEWDRPSYTILASARHILLHPDSPKMVKVDKDRWEFEGTGKVRRLSVKECAAIQTFPQNYKFVGSVIDKYALIGDAVPPLLAKAFAEKILQSLVEAGCEPSFRKLS